MNQQIEAKLTGSLLTITLIEFFLPEHDGCKGCLKSHQQGSLRLKESISDQMVSAQTASETMVSSR
ncbi:hypothetical protein [Synechococcus sp. MIT S9510]|uniref:hypothetical protein n=1 Tax=unclassified Synechococcus TaxID=2626047 RepID=UPI0039B0C378